jgi:DNA-directed RNA polymerase specialized sigma24 family protein
MRRDCDEHGFRIVPMSFPETRLTLIQRLASGGTAEDWQGFLRDYWGPVCRFALRSGAGQLSDAEDIASQTFEVLWENRLLVRWIGNHTARLRSLLCSVTRKILSNRQRVRAGRQRLARDAADQWVQPEAVDDEQSEIFYAAWVEDLLRQALESVAAAYYREAKGDHVRVLYSRLCLGVSMAVMATELGTTPSSVNNYFRDARQRLADTLETLLRRQVERYSTPAVSAQELQDEWQRLGTYLREHGGLEEAVRRAYEVMDPVVAQKNQRTGLRAAAERIASAINRSR